MPTWREDALKGAAIGASGFSQRGAAHRRGSMALISPERPLCAASTSRRRDRGTAGLAGFLTYLQIGRACTRSSGGKPRESFRGGRPVRLVKEYKVPEMFRAVNPRTRAEFCNNRRPDDRSLDRTSPIPATGYTSELP